MRERKRNRLKDYSYSQEGYYFVTICTKDREEWFGNIEQESVNLSRYGKIAHDFWVGIPTHFENVAIDELSVMPNHMHGILIIEGDMVGNAYMRSLQNRTNMLLSKIIQQYKASVTRKINSLEGGLHFGWQKSFYDHVIRNDRSLDNLRQYIINNSLKWELDIENRKGNSPHKNCVDYYREIIGKEIGNAYMRSLHR
jgi:putative transposase